MTVKSAIASQVIQKHWQPMYRHYRWTADGQGDKLFVTAYEALQAYITWRNEREEAL